MSFPRHKELLNDEYYDHTDHGNQWDYKDPRNEFGNANEKMDFEDWDKSMHRPTSRGVLSSYKKRLNLSPEDVMMKDYWDQMKGLEQNVQNSMDITDRRQFTKNMVQRIKL